MFEEFQRKFVNNFITSDRWQYIADGLITTLQVTFFAVIIGIISVSLWLLCVLLMIRQGSLRF